MAKHSVSKTLPEINDKMATACLIIGRKYIGRKHAFFQKLQQADS